MKSIALAYLTTTLLACAASGALAQTSGDIVVGASLPLSGPNAAAGQEGLAVLNAYFESVNQAGGIEGRLLRLNALDDAFNPQKAAENARQLIDAKVVALVNCWGTSSCSALVPIANQAGIPLVGGIAGGGVMRSAPGRHAFNIRASTAAEIDAMVRQMTSIGQKNIAVVYQDDGFGKGGQAAASAVLQQHQLAAVVELPVAPDGSNAASVVTALAALPAVQGVIMVASPPATIAVVTQARKNGLSTQFYNLAAQASQTVVQGLGANTSGVVFTTLVPSPWRSIIPQVQQYQRLFSASTGTQNYSYLGMEVFINARTLVDGLRKAGRGVQRESLTTALENLGTQQNGPMMVRFSPGQREGSSYVGLAMIDRRGRFIE